MTLAGIAALPVGAAAAYAIYQKLTDPHLLTYSEQSTTILDAAWSPDGTRVASSGWLDGGTVKIWNAATGKTLQTCSADNPGPAMVPVEVMWSADGKYVTAFVGSDHEMALTAGSRIVEMVQVWDVATGQRVRSIPVMAPATVNDLGTETDRPLVYKWALNERYLAAVNAQDTGILEIWEIATGNKIATLSVGTQRPPSKVQEIVWAPDTETLAIHWIAQDSTNQQYDRTVEIWNIATLNKIATLHIESQSLLAQTVWAPDSRTLALILQRRGKPETGDIWDALAGKKLRTIQPAADHLSAKPWSPNGKYLLQGNTLFDVETGNRIITYKLEGGVNSQAWSPDGTRVALVDVVYSGHGLFTTSRSTLSVLDALSGRQIAKYRGVGLFGGGGTSGNVAWSPDGKHVMVVGQKVDIWKAE